MLIKDAFEQTDSSDLQALIMFLVFEKEVLTMDDDTDELKLYFQQKHRKRMNKEMNDYRKMMNMSYKPSIYRVKMTDRVFYIYAQNRLQAMSRTRGKVIDINYVDEEELFHSDGKDKKIGTLIDGRVPPLLVGWNREESKVEHTHHS